jgi:1,2-diacylglycerol 3-alpha-glucosyltransferase
VRVLFISDVYFPRVNGVSTSIRTFREDLARCGVETLLVAPRYEPQDARGTPASGTPASGTQASGTQASGGPDPKAPGDAKRPGGVGEGGVLRVPARQVPGDPEDRRMSWRALTRELDSLEASALDLVHIHTPFIAHYAGVRFARRAGLRAVVTYHTFFEEYLHHYLPVLPRRIGRLLARSFTRSQCAAVEAVIAPSEQMRAVLTDYGLTTPIHVLPTGLAADRFRAGNGAAFRASAGIPTDRPLVTYIGRVAHEKNIAFLVEVFAEVVRSMPSALLVIAGEGPARESLRAQVRALGLGNQVHFAGYLERDTELLDCYAAADVLVFASRTETQGLVLLEAMAQGTPVVSIAELGTRSILVPGSGALVVPEERDTFAAAVVRVLSEATLRAELSERGRTYARSWSSATMAARLTQLYSELVNAPRKVPAAA